MCIRDSNYITTTNGYIRQGVVGYEGLTPVIGIASGQDIKVTGAKETVGGVEYETIDTTQNMSIWTADKLSFYVSGREAVSYTHLCHGQFPGIQHLAPGTGG